MTIRWWLWGLVYDLGAVVLWLGDWLYWTGKRGQQRNFRRRK